MKKTELIEAYVKFLEDNTTSGMTRNGQMLILLDEITEEVKKKFQLKWYQEIGHEETKQKD